MNITVYVHHQENDIKFDRIVKKSKSDLQQNDALGVFLQGLLLEKVEFQSRRACSPSSAISVHMDDCLDSSRNKPLHNRVCKTKSLPSRFKNYSDHDSFLVENRWHNSSSSLDGCMIGHRRLNQVRHSTTSIPSYRPYPKYLTSANSLNEKNKYEVEPRQDRTRRDSSLSNRGGTNLITLEEHRLMQVEKRSTQRWRPSRTLNDFYPTSPPQCLCSKRKKTISLIRQHKKVETYINVD